MRVLRSGLALATLTFVLAVQNEAHAATIEVQGVSASNPSSDKDKSIPESLDAYKATLQAMPFKTFKDIGHDSVKGDTGAKGNATIGSYSFEVSVTKSEKGKATANITVKENGKAIGEPMAYELAAGQPRQIKVGAETAPKIIFFTLK